TQTDYTVTATNTGGSTTATFTLTVNAIAPTPITLTQSSVISVINSTNILMVPTVTGTGITFSISPALPAGVTLNPSTGVISGTPSALMAKTMYTLTATNSGGSVSTTFSIEVSPAAPTANPAQAVCGSGTVADLVATAPAGSSVRWYTVATAGTPLLSTTALVTATTYYAESWSGLVASATRTAVVMTINVIPAKPVLVPTSTAKNKIKLCPGDNIVCSNFDNTLSYQWKLNGNNLTGQTTNQYKVPASGAGVYSLYVKNATTGCDISSANVTVDVYTVTTPVIYEKKKSDYISILIVDNRLNLYSSYLWTYSDGTALPSTIVNDRQFLVLPPTNMSATYMVNITDTNSCKVTSAVKTVALHTIAAKAYPTLNNGNFMVGLTDAQDGKLNVRIFNQNGILQKVYSFDNISSEFEYQINAAGLKTGSYTVEISLGDYVQTQKMIIQ
ncbi:MAG: putative Ig domain-containing protein, partial [Paludibacter sp.]